jgi:hypothetical protein
MIALGPPKFIPSGAGFKAPYSLNFAADLSYLVSLSGEIQGSGIQVKTLEIDNTANGSDCRINLRGRDVFVPPYSLVRVNCGESPDAIIVGGSASAKVTANLLTYFLPEETRIKKVQNVGGFPPIGASQNLVSISSNNNPIKVFSIGDPVTNFVDLTNSASSAANLAWGFDSNCSMGTLAPGSSYRISMTCETNELWVKFTGGSGSGGGTYTAIGG